MDPNKIKETISIRMDQLSNFTMLEPGELDAFNAVANEIAYYTRLFKPQAYDAMMKSIEKHTNTYEELTNQLSIDSKDVISEVKPRDVPQKHMEHLKGLRDAIVESYFDIIYRFEVLP